MSEIEVLAEPQRGTLAWLQQQPTVQWYGIEIPACHRIPDGATLHLGEDDGHCKVVFPGERGRCRAARTRRWGICSGHLGGGDPQAASLAGHVQRAKIRQRRMLLGIGPARIANPRQAARLRALERVDDIAQALIDAPLDDASLGSMERQLAVVRALDQTFPLQAMSVEVELPADSDGVSAMGWEAMQQLAGQLLAEDEPGQLEAGS